MIASLYTSYTANTRRVICIAAFLIAVIILNFHRVPNGDETLYLILPFKAYHPDFLLGDWTISGSWPSHDVFNYATGWLTYFLSIELFGYVGRCVTWILLTILVFRIGSRFELSNRQILVALLIWLIAGQPFAGSHSLFNWFTSKSVAYIFAFLALDYFLLRRFFASGLAIGLAFSIHSVVGLWCGFALGIAILLDHDSRPNTFKFAFAALLTSIPGLIMVSPFVFGNSHSSSDSLGFMFEHWYWHPDPYKLPKREVVAFLLTVPFLLLRMRAEGTREYRIAAAIVTSLAVAFCLAFAARGTDQFWYLQFFPMRVGPLVALLLFSFALAYGWKTRFERFGPASMVLAVIILASLPNPIGTTVDRMVLNKATWNLNDDISSAFQWIRHHSPNDAVVLSPPWRGDSWYMTRRAQVVVLQSPPRQKIDEWRKRLESILGESIISYDAERSWSQRLVKAYESLDEKKIIDLSRKYGCDYVIAKKGIPLHIVFESGHYAVYDVSTITDKR